jgi:alkylation response protein AidB-like acyl-CoA dehydrogenase
VSIDDVRVPLRNTIGDINDGFRAVMINFNHERFVLAACSNRYARVCLAEAIAYARVRHTFGRRLIDHQVIRHKIGEMARRVEATHALIEQCVFNMRLPHADGAGDTSVDYAGAAGDEGDVALLKVQATKTYEFCAREASQIMG